MGIYTDHEMNHLRGCLLVLIPFNLPECQLPQSELVNIFNEITKDNKAGSSKHNNTKKVRCQNKILFLHNEGLIKTIINKLYTDIHINKWSQQNKA